MTAAETASPLVPLGRGWYKHERYALWVGPPLCDAWPLRDVLRLSLPRTNLGPALRLSVTTIEPEPGEDIADAIEDLADDEDHWTEVTLPPVAIDMLFIAISRIRDQLADAANVIPIRRQA